MQSFHVLPVAKKLLRDKIGMLFSVISLLVPRTSLSADCPKLLQKRLDIESAGKRHKVHRKRKLSEAAPGFEGF
jgi:hypothetical protein